MFRYDTFYNTSWVYGGIGFVAHPTRRAGVLGDLWSYNTVSGQWKYVLPTLLVHHPLNPHAKPPVRFDPAFCGVHGIILVLHGGLSAQGVPLDDTWIFDQG